MRTSFESMKNETAKLERTGVTLAMCGRRMLFGMCTAVMLFSLCASSFAQEQLLNGAFEGGGAACGNDDECPDSWTLHETRDEEDSRAMSVADNGPSAGGTGAWDFFRDAGSATGDWTTIEQTLSIDATAFESIMLSMDVKVYSHTLEGGGCCSFEWPAIVDITYTDTGAQTRTWRFGWYLSSPGDGGADNFEDLEVSPGVWQSNCFDLLSELTDVATIDRIRVGGSGWAFHSRFDNVSIVGGPAPLECLTSTVNSGIGPVADVLSVNGSTGNCMDGSVLIQAGQLLSGYMELPPAGGPGKYVVHANCGEPDELTETILPSNIGTACFPFLLSNGAAPCAVFNNIGKESLVGDSRYFDGNPAADPPNAPGLFLFLNNGDTTNLPPGTTVTFQGIILDPGSASPKMAGTTNAVVAKIL